MSVGHRQILRLADDIRTQLLYLKSVRHREVQRELGFLLERFEPLREAERALAASSVRGWDCAAEQVLTQVDRLVREIPQVTGMVRRAAQRCCSKVPSLRDVHQQLHQLADQLGNVEYDRERDVVSVVTEPVELKNGSLAPLEIRLWIGRLAALDSNTAYDIVAPGPHPGRANSPTSPPLVCHEHLNTPDGAASIRTALADGRICDFFVLVRSRLTRYDPSHLHT